MGSFIKKAATGVGVIVVGLPTAGLITNNIEMVGNDDGYGYQQEGHRVLDIPLFGQDFYISTESFDDSERIRPSGLPFDSTVQWYRPDTALSEAATLTLAESLKALGMVCPVDAMTLKYDPDPEDRAPATSSATETTITANTIEEKPDNSIDLRICVDYSEVSAAGVRLAVPLTLESRSGVPDQEIKFEKRIPRCIEIAFFYADIVNAEAVRVATELGMDVTAESKLPTVINMSKRHSDPCDGEAFLPGEHRR